MDDYKADLVVEKNEELQLLKQDIYKKRIELQRVIQDVKDYLVDKEVIQLSQQLDHLLVKYMKFSIDTSSIQTRNI